MPNRRSDPAAAAFTRSQREIFLHRTRSGRSRPDPVAPRGRRRLDDLLVPPLSKHWGILVRYDRDRLSIKDLRARRVFSPASVSVDDGTEKSGGALEVGIKEAEFGAGLVRCTNVRQSDKVTGSCAGEDVMEGVGFGPEIRDASGVESTQKEDVNFGEDGMKVCDGEVGNGSGVDEVLKNVDLESLKENAGGKMESTQKGSVDLAEDRMEGVEHVKLGHGGEIVCESGVAEVSKGREGCSVDFVQCTPPDEHTALESQKESVSTQMENSLLKMDLSFPSKGRQGVARRSQLRLFQNKSSFGYRRMLPFLMDIVKDNPNDVPALPCQNSLVKGEKMGEGRSLLPQVKSSPKEIVPLEESGSSLKDEGLKSLNSNALLSKVSNRVPGLVDVPPTGSIRRVAEDIQNTSSFGYRRMLPFLLDLAKDNPNAVHIPPCQNSSARCEKLGKEILLLPPVESLSKEILPLEDSGISVNDDTLKNLSSDVLLCNEPNNIQDLVDAPATGSINPVVEDVFQDPAVHMPNPGDEVISVTEPDTFVDVTDVASDPLSLSSQLQHVVPEAVSMDDLTEKASLVSEWQLAVQSNIIRKDPAMEVEHNPSSQTVQSSSVRSSQKLSLAPRKGILKRSSKGCKGICMCLDCASFRIHADRAFEFSRKQMQEVDEITVGLVKELCSLRNLVEKTALPTPCSQIDPMHQLNQDLLKAACLRASRAEEVAKDHIRRMFNDLNAHCRIPGPRVTFEESLEEKMP